MKADKLTIFMAAAIILVIVVVGTSQYRQLNLATTTVEQNQLIYHAALTAVRELNNTDHKLMENSLSIMNNVTKQHDKIMKFINENTVTNNLQLQKLEEHMKNTEQNLNLTKINTGFLKDTNRIIHDILDIVRNSSSITIINSNKSF